MCVVRKKKLTLLIVKLKFKVFDSKRIIYKEENYRLVNLLFGHKSFKKYASRQRQKQGLQSYFQKYLYLF